MRNKLPFTQTYQNKKKTFNTTDNFTTDDSNVEVLEQYDNPMRPLLSSNFLSMQICASNYLKQLDQKQHYNNNLSKKVYSLFQVDSLMMDQVDSLMMDQNSNQQNQPNDLVMQQMDEYQRNKPIPSICDGFNLQQLKSINFIQETKNIILSSRNIYDPIEIKPQTFIEVKHSNIRENYHIMEKIGQGTFGNVHKARCRKTNQLRAIKILKKTKNKTENIIQNNGNGQKELRELRELKALRMLDHPNIIKLYQVYCYNDFYYIVLQLCQGGCVLKYFRHCKTYCEAIIKTIVKQLLSALCYLHSIKIAHRDIKLENIVFIKPIKDTSNVNDIQIKLIDFGEALYLKYSHNNKDRKEIGTITYMAPEVLEGQYSEKCDIWSVGVTLYMLVSGHNPFKRQTKADVIKCIKQKVIDLKGQIWSQASQSLKTLILRMLQRNPLKRISAKQALKSPWFSQIQESISSVSMKQVVEKLFDYFRGNNLISVVQTYLSFIRTTQEESFEINKIFKKLDKDNSGTIDINELKEAFSICADQDYNQPIEFILRKIDQQKTKHIDLNEFVTAFYGRKLILLQNSLQMAFQYFDSDKNGHIDKKELARALKGCGQEQVNILMQEINQNQDNKITKDQFIRYIHQQRLL